MSSQSAALDAEIYLDALVSFSIDIEIVFVEKRGECIFRTSVFMWEPDRENREREPERAAHTLNMVKWISDSTVWDEAQEMNQTKSFIPATIFLKETRSLLRCFQTEKKNYGKIHRSPFFLNIVFTQPRGRQPENSDHMILLTWLTKPSWPFF